MRDVDACTTLEAEGFTPEDRASREKFIYRLTACPELSVGLFMSESTADKDPSVPRKEILLGHCIATKVVGDVVTDNSMGIPPTFIAKHFSDPKREPTAEEIAQEKEALERKENYGHAESGKTIALHSVVVHPSFQKKGYGQLIVKEFMARMARAGFADKIAILVKPSYVKFYRPLGFEETGESDCGHGGGGWVNMVYKLEPPA